MEKVGSFSNVFEEKFKETRVFPAYSKGFVTIFSPSKSTIKVMDRSGRVMVKYRSEGNLTIAMNYSNGLYFIFVEAQYVTAH